MTTTRTALAAAAAAAALALTACSADSSDAAPEAEEPTSEPAPAEPTTEAADEPEEPPADARCERVSKAMAAAILSGAENGTGKLAPTGRAAAVRSDDFEKLFFIAVEFKAAGVGSEVGVWASNSLQPGGGTILAVDGMAQEFTVWPDGDTTSAAISSADDGAAEAADCAAS